MPTPEVIASIQRMHLQGISSAQIHQSLIASGYQPADADRALRVAGLRRTSWFPIVAGISGGVAVIIIILIISNIGPAFTMKTVPQAVEARAGASISFGESFTFERSIDADEMVLRHELIAPATGNLILQLEQRVDITDYATSKVSLPDDLQPGRYLIKTIADADGHTAEASFSFKVLPSQTKRVYQSAPSTSSIPDLTSTTTPTASTQCNDFDACTTDRGENGVCVFEPMPVCCGDYVCDYDKGETTSTCSRDCATAPIAKPSGEIVAEAEEIASSDAGRAELLCGTLAQTADADQCYDLVARKIARSETCGSIITDTTRDSCYLSFAINNKQFDVCASITNPNLQSSCYSFKNLAELQSSA